MIRRDPYWCAAEWAVVLVWKTLTLVGTAALVYSAVIAPGGFAKTALAVFAFVLALMFLFTQPDV